jgi:hypothetical protein
MLLGIASILMLCSNTPSWKPDNKYRGKYQIIGIKGTVRDGYFFESLNILISTFCVCADSFQDLPKSSHYPKQ